MERWPIVALLLVCACQSSKARDERAPPVAALAPMAAPTASRPSGREPCGQSPSDWCTSAADGPCGAHPNEAECRKDPRCKGQPYAGESVVACTPDGKGFSSNCPSVGCIAR